MLKVRIEDDKLEPALLAWAESHGLTVDEVVVEWARRGCMSAHRQELPPTITSVLDGRANYDDLDPEDQALVRDTWTKRIEERLQSPDLVAAILANGACYAEVDANGDVSVGRAR